MCMTTAPVTSPTTTRMTSRSLPPYPNVPASGDPPCASALPGYASPAFALKAPMMKFASTTALFALTAVAEIVGCYLPWLVLKQGRPIWLLLPAAVSLALFAWLLTLHPAAAGRVYAAYGGVYIAVAIGWLWLVDGIRPDRWDVIGSGVALAGMAIIYFGPRAPS